MHNDEHYLQRAVQLAAENVSGGGRPFGAVLVKHDQILAEAANTIHVTQDPTAHAELLVIRAASQQLGARLHDCVIYASGQPCPMCLSAMYLSGVARVVFGATNQQGAPFGLSTEAIYQQLAHPVCEQTLPVRHLAQPGIEQIYRDWQARHAGG